jgi:hypothetical protein
VNKDWRNIYKKLDMPNSSDDERMIQAWCLAASPEERWARNERFFREYGLSNAWDRLAMKNMPEIRDKAVADFNQRDAAKLRGKLAAEHGFEP